MIPTIEHLQAAKIKNPEKWIDAIVATCEEFEINNPNRIAGFYLRPHMSLVVIRCFLRI